jgi:hypothetical protein
VYSPKLNKELGVRKTSCGIILLDNFNDYGEGENVGNGYLEKTDLGYKVHANEVDQIGRGYGLALYVGLLTFAFIEHNENYILSCKPRSQEAERFWRKVFFYKLGYPVSEIYYMEINSALSLGLIKWMSKFPSLLSPNHVQPSR